MLRESCYFQRKSDVRILSWSGRALAHLQRKDSSQIHRFLQPLDVRPFSSGIVSSWVTLMKAALGF